MTPESMFLSANVSCLPRLQTTTASITYQLTGAKSPDEITEHSTKENRTLLREKRQWSIKQQFNKHLLSTSLFSCRHYARRWSTKVNKTITWGRHTHMQTISV